MREKRVQQRSIGVIRRVVKGHVRCSCIGLGARGEVVEEEW
jgi:hypothetical protein